MKGSAGKEKSKKINISQTAFFTVDSITEYRLYDDRIYRRILPKKNKEEKPELAEWKPVKIEEANLLANVLNDPEDWWSADFLSYFWGGLAKESEFDFLYKGIHEN